MKHTLLRRLYTVLTALLAVFLVYTVSTQNWLQTDLTALLPSEQQPDALLTAADKAGEAQLNTQVVLLAGSKDAETAFQTASCRLRPTRFRQTASSTPAPLSEPPPPSA